MNGNDIMNMMDDICACLANLETDERTNLLNEIRSRLHNVSPFASEPVDCVLWKKADDIQPNEYNPNYVAGPEMRLLEHSIDKYHYAMCIVAWDNKDGTYTVIDGEHRHIVGTTNQEINSRLYGYLPISLLDGSLTEADKVSATIDFNRARGVHKVIGMAEIVKMLIRDNWSDEKIAKELGMSVEELLRLKQTIGIAESLANKEYGKAWIMK